MSQLFSRARAKQFFFPVTKRAGFKARSVERDTETDHLRAGSVLLSIEAALSAAEAEHAGLNQRVEDVIARAAATIGNAADEYLTRDARDTHHQNLLGAEIFNGQRRLQEIANTITHFNFLKEALLARFPNVKTPKGKMKRPF